MQRGSEIVWSTDNVTNLLKNWLGVWWLFYNCGGEGAGSSESRHPIKFRSRPRRANTPAEQAVSGWLSRRLQNDGLITKTSMAQAGTAGAFGHSHKTIVNDKRAASQRRVALRRNYINAMLAQFALLPLTPFFPRLMLCGR